MPRCDPRLKAPEDGRPAVQTCVGRGGQRAGEGRREGHGADNVALTGTFIHARGQWHRSTSTRGPTFPEHSQAGVPSAESWLVMTMSRCGAGSFPKRSTR